MRNNRLVSAANCCFFSLRRTFSSCLNYHPSIRAQRREGNRSRSHPPPSPLTLPPLPSPCPAALGITFKEGRIQNRCCLRGGDGAVEWGGVGGKRREPLSRRNRARARRCFPHNYPPPPPRSALPPATAFRRRGGEGAEERKREEEKKSATLLLLLLQLSYYYIRRKKIAYCFWGRGEGARGKKKCSCALAWFFDQRRCWLAGGTKRKKKKQTCDHRKMPSSGKKDDWGRRKGGKKNHVIGEFCILILYTRSYVL